MGYTNHLEGGIGDDEQTEDSKQNRNLYGDS